MTSSKACGLFGSLRIEWGHADSHRDDRFTSVSDTVFAGEGDQRLAVGASGYYQLLAVLIGSLDRVNGTSVVGVCAIKQRDQDARIEGQRSHSSRSRSSSPER